MTVRNDSYYVEQVLQGEVDQFAELVDRYSNPVFALIVRIVVRRERAEELVQDVFLKAFGSLSSFRRQSSFSTWIYRIAYNTAISDVRRKKQYFVDIDQHQIANIEDDNLSEAFSAAAQQERYDAMERALNRLEDHERALVQLFYMEEHTLEEAAEIMDISLSNAKVKIHRIRKKLFLLINEDHENR